MDVKGNFSFYILDINKVRARAAFKVVKLRNEVLARLYPGEVENLQNRERMALYCKYRDSDFFPCWLMKVIGQVG